MHKPWLHSVFPIALIFSFRMLGLFMLIPVFSVMAKDLTYATPVLIGLALGAYGLTQGLLQIPSGMLSDRFGRKPIISIGLLLFAIGSVLGALSESIYGMIFARTLQGMGAIGSVLIALTADLTKDEHRTKAMAVIGMTIGISFALAMIISPPIAKAYGLAGIFWFSTALSLLGIGLVWGVIPNPRKEILHVDSSANPAMLGDVLRNTSLLRLNFGIFIQHYMLTTTFFAVPIILHRPMADGSTLDSWYFYLPVMLVAFLVMIPFIIAAESKQKMKAVMLGSIASTLVAQLLLSYYNTEFICFTLLMILYFSGFNILEACLPSLISKHAPLESKGTAMGVYSSFQFLGIFAGGLCAGILYSLFKTEGIFYSNTIICVIWLLLFYHFEPLSYTSSVVLTVPETINREKLQIALASMPGIKNVFCAKTEPLVYLKVHKKLYDPGSVETLISDLKDK